MDNFTFLKSRRKVKMGMLLLFLSIFTFSISTNAQYCSSGATSTNDEDIASVYLKGNTVTLNNVSPSNCMMYSDFTSLTPVDLSAGSSYTVVVTEQTCNSHYTYGCNVWIDYNMNNAFESNEAVAATSQSKSGANGVFSYTWTVPCNISPGTTRMRVVLIEGTVTNPTSACGTYTWGETEDYKVTLQLPTSLSCNFTAPAQAWVKSVVKFINANQAGYISHTWDANNDGVIEAPNSINFNYTWTTPGNKCIKLKSANCLGTDSIVKCLNIQAPTAVPVGDFVADRVNVQQYDKIRIFDLSQNGPYQWDWDVYDSTTYASSGDYPSIASGAVIPDPDGLTFTEKTQNPEFSFDKPGCYTVVLRTKNDVGPSIPTVKVCYITVTLPTNYYLGYGTYGPNVDNVVGTSSGIIADDGGPNNNYGNNQGLGSRSYLQITPCNATKITLKMTQLKFVGTDKLSVWDGKSPGGPGTTQLAAWTSADKGPKTVVATSGSMYLLFESDASGNDSGYLGSYTSELGPATLPTPTFTPNTVPSYNSTPVYFTNTTQNIVGVPTWEWTVNDNQVLYNSKKDFRYTFSSDGQYKVCVEMKSCIGNNKSCSIIDVVTPNQTTTLDLKASNRRPNINVDKTVLTPISDNANRFEFTIFPTTYTLTNPPSGLGSSYGAGFIKYGSIVGDSIPTPILKFSNAGCYTITIKAWNSLDPVNTVKTVVKNKFICAVDYCVPNAYILSTDVGINRVKLMDGTTELINNYSTSGDQAYTDFSTTARTNLTYGKTYTLEVSRTGNIDPANRKAWIDWNIDGDFDDLGEEILTDPSSYNQIKSVTFTVPALAQSFEGFTRLRVASNYNNELTTPCGPLTAGEYEDYGIILGNDNSKPVITLIGEDTVRVEVGSVYNDAGATAYDISEGDISANLVITNDVETGTPGVYTVEFNITDKSGNPADAVQRTVIVVNDLTPPVLTLNPGNPGCISAKRNNDPYIDPGATASDNKAPFNLTSSIITKGTVNTSVVGNYTITYTVQDVAGNMISKSRSVCVVDNVKPVIHEDIDTAIQIGSTWFDLTYVTDEYDNFPVLTKEWGFNGQVNTLSKSSYPVTYRAYDSSGNQADIKVRTYRVDDFIPPVIALGTFDVVEHDVRTVYNSVMPTVTDNYYDVAKNEVSLRKIYDDVDYTTLGTYKQIYEAIDGSGNVSQKTRTVKVIDRVAPQVWGPSIHGCVGDNIWPMWGLTTTDNYYGPSVLLPRVEIIYQDVNPMEEGTYNITYRVTDPSGNTSVNFTRDVYYTYWPKCYNSTVSVDDTKTADEKISVYPNPSNGKVSIDLQGSLAQNATLEVYNAMGQLVVSESYNELKGKFELDLSGNAAGVYTIKLLVNGEVITRRVVLQ